METGKSHIIYRLAYLVIELPIRDGNQIGVKNSSWLMTVIELPIRDGNGSMWRTPDAHCDSY